MIMIGVPALDFDGTSVAVWLFFTDTFVSLPGEDNNIDGKIDPF